MCRCADCLANLSCIGQKTIAFDCLDELPHALKGIVRTDKAGIPNLRFKS